MTDRPRISINDFINECWEVDDTGWSFHFYSDQWWLLRADSEALGEFSLPSRGQCDVEETLYLLLEKIKNYEKG